MSKRIIYGNSEYIHIQSSEINEKKNANENATWNIRSVGLKVPRGIEVIGFKHYLLSKALKGLPHN